MRATYLSLTLLLFISSFCELEAFEHYNSFKPGEIWNDNNGVHINAHGGGILYDYKSNLYYWYGEHKIEGRLGNSAQVGVHVYSSKDLYNWNDKGIALSVSNSVGSDVEKGCTIERPKVIYNEATNKYVMWFHLELKGRGYEAARAALAISDSPTGPFEYVKSLRPNAGYWPINLSKEDCENKETIADYPKWWTKEWYKAVDKGLFTRRDFIGGQMSRDMQLFIDDDGKAYHIFSSEDNLTLNIAELSDDYQTHTGKYSRVFSAGHNEAPAIFKKGGKYYMITSGCTGWDPNEARFSVADSIFGPWTMLGNRCEGIDAHLTFRSQSTYILPVIGKKDVFIYLGDRWAPQNPIDGRYIWLPIEFKEGLPYIRWREEWNLKSYK